LVFVSVVMVIVHPLSRDYSPIENLLLGLEGWLVGSVV
jgi:hypothetical protein